MTNLPSVAVCTITADRRLEKHSGAIPHVFNYPGPMWYYVNVQTNHLLSDSYSCLEALSAKIATSHGVRAYIDEWHIESTWRPQPRFDQDQARLWAICAARNFCVDFAQYKRADWLLFLDSDVVVPADSIQKLMEIAYYGGKIRHYVVGGCVPGRGDHSGGEYIFWPNQPTSIMYRPFGSEKLTNEVVEVVRVQHATMGFVMIHKNVFNWLRFGPVTDNHWYTDRSGVTPGSLSEDPAFGIVLRYLFSQLKEYGSAYEWIVRLDLKAKHVGPLDRAEAAQF